MTSARQQAAVSHSRAGLPSRANNGFAFAVLIAIALSPLPFGSNRPFYWAVAAAIWAAIAIALILTTAANGRAPCVRVERYRLLGTLAGLFVIWNLIQMLPVGIWWGQFPYVSRAGDVVFSNTISIAPRETWFSNLRFLTYVLVFYCVVQIAGKSFGSMRRILTAMLCICTAYAVYGLLALNALGDTILVFPKWTYLGAATGPFVNRNSFATYLGFGSIIGVALTCSAVAGSSSASRRLATQSAWFYAACTVVILSGLFATQSRMGVAATTFALATVAGMFWLKSGRTTRRAGLILFVGAGIFLSISGLYGGGLFERFSSVADAAGIRWDLYGQVIDMIAARPLTGYGGGTFALAFPLFHGAEVNPDLVWDRAHSSYLTLWSDHGLIAGSVPLVILILIVWRCLTLWHRSESQWEAPLIAFGALVLAALHSLVDFSVEIQANAVFLTALMGVGLSQANSKSSFEQSHSQSPGTGSSRPVSQVAHSPYGAHIDPGLPGREPGQSRLRVQRDRLTLDAMPSVVYAIGDVHGCLDLLLKLEAQIVEDLAAFTGDKLTVMLGDYVDRGPQSAQVIDHLLSSPPPGFQRVCLAGNHEQMMMEACLDPGRVVGWLSLGADETLRSYGVDTFGINLRTIDKQQLSQLIASHIPREHLEFLKELPVTLSLPGYLFVHAGARSNVALDQQSDNELMNLRMSETAEFEHGGVTLVHGHTPLLEPLASANRICPDTGGYSSGRLTAARITREGAVHFIISTRGSQSEHRSGPI